MSYKATYKDETGLSKEMSITEEDSREALKNDFAEINRRYNPRYVSIERVQAKTGEAMHIKVTVNAPSHYLTGPEDDNPKPCNSMTADITCYPGYPVEKVLVSYSKNRRLASPNVFSSGAACIDTWYPFKSSMVTVVDKLVHDMIHDPNVSRYDSPACSKMIQWHKDGVAAGRFPTIEPKLLDMPETVALPPRRSRKVDATPPLPSRRTH